MKPKGLGARLLKRDPAELKNRVFNLPPPAQLYPDWLVGEWQVTSNFAGYLFPSTKLSRERLIANASVPGFQKCSVAATCDIGKEQVAYRWRVDETNLEDRSYNLAQAIDAHLGYRAVDRVLYDPSKNPNRISIDFVDYKTVNAERIELFCNARESESYEVAEGEGGRDGSKTTDVFVCSEYVRQVTFGTGQTYGVPRQAVTNYAHFWTWRKENPVDQDSTVEGNLLTAGYLDAQDPLYFDEPTLPVVVYSHRLSATKAL